MTKFTWFPSHVIKIEFYFQKFIFQIQLEIIYFFLFSAPFCTLSIIVKMSIHDKSVTNENKFGPKGQHYVDLSEIISKCF